jgi:hypothetical protein
MAVDGDKRRRKDPIQVTYNDDQVRTTKQGEAVRYLGFYATPNGNMQESIHRVFKKTRNPPRSSQDTSSSTKKPSRSSPRKQ